MCSPPTKRVGEPKAPRAIASSVLVRRRSFTGWLDAHHPLEKDGWVRLFRKTFRFTGGEITGEFLMSIGYLPGAHHPACPVHDRIAALGPRWMDGSA